METKEKYIPHVVEPSAGVDRICLALLCAAYTEEEIAPGDVRIVMKFAPRIAPVKVAVFPLLRNKPPLVEKAKQVWNMCIIEDACNNTNVIYILRPYFATSSKYIFGRPLFLGVAVPFNIASSRFLRLYSVRFLLHSSLFL